MQPGNVLKISTLDEEWCDKDRVMPHACFQLLTDCVEEEKLYEFTDFEHNPESKKVKKEIDELYQWWNTRISPGKNVQNNENETEEQYQEDNEMLIRLIKIREHLWT
jgi:pyruvate/2-oxoacid:ferredoxin oxidoreductase beta subunit